MHDEKYSRQIKLFGSQAQKKIESSHIHVLDQESKIQRHICRLLSQLGANVCLEAACTDMPTWAFICGAPERGALERAPAGCTMYISTETLSISRKQLAQAPGEARAKTSREEYINILAGVAVQEYIKSLTEMKALDEWTLDTSMFE
ncbi:uncharacterized protein NEMAJ01_1198 [Nematocida major]|uniref:uncharacterized protein n=1 Tax=Nematocida major TaxID=1912982 RepID=UPI0020074BF6|nr:uncharacterized protein NEMAJ01_1198 [Nematocida major]KAH9386302.1 hypothetical protein NEMAJ01_1198 [Nematocida major]